MFRLLASLVLLLIAVSVIRSVLKTIYSFWAGLGNSSVRPSAFGGPKVGAPTALQQDPVCGTYVAVDASLKRVVNGKVVHFCSEECRDRFKA